MATILTPSAEDLALAGGMTRLQIVQRTKKECGLLGTSPTTTISQTGMDGKIVQWTDSAWLDIQGSRNWDFLWEAAPITINAGQYTSEQTVPAARYLKDGVTDAHGAELTYLPWVDFRRAYPTALITTGNPRVWTVRPDKAFAVNAKPSTTTIYSAERYQNPVAMTLDADVPALPYEAHMLIVWKAVMLYCGHDENVSLYKHAQIEYTKILTKMGWIESPAVEFGACW